MKKLLTKLEKRDIIDKHSKGTEMDRKNRKEETAEARWPTGKKFKTVKKEI